MPRVVDPSLKIVFCEGRPGSLDDLLLGHLMPVGKVLIQPYRLQEYAETYRGRFNAPHFLEERGYLVWFHGKDHLVHLCHRLAPNFPQRHYVEWAAEHVDLRKHPDLQQLVAAVY